MNAHPSRHPSVRNLACLMIALTVISCQTTGVRPMADAPASVTPSHWSRVSNHPPTFYPRGVPADHPTDHRSGEWVATGDPLGTRYFIPLHGLGKVDRQSLVREAFSARSDKKLAQLAAEDRELRNKHVKYSLFLIPANVLLAIGGGSIDEAQLEDLGAEIKAHWKDELAAN